MEDRENKQNEGELCSSNTRGYKLTAGRQFTPHLLLAGTVLQPKHFWQPAAARGCLHLRFMRAMTKKSNSVGSRQNLDWQEKKKSSI